MARKLDWFQRPCQPLFVTRVAEFFASTRMRRAFSSLNASLQPNWHAHPTNNAAKPHSRSQILGTDYKNSVFVRDVSAEIYAFGGTLRQAAKYAFKASAGVGA